MTTIATDVTLAALVDEHPAVAHELERLGLDYCCGGRRSLGDACAGAGLDAHEVVALLRDADAAAPDRPAPWVGLGPAELVDHLEAVHHRPLDAELPRLAALSEKVRDVHGDRHPELVDVDATLTELRADLEPHLRKEEVVLFPMIRELATADVAPSFHCGTLRNPISVMLVEHDRAGELLHRMRTLTGGYAPPDDACASYRALYEGLADLEADTHLHVHKENNVLFPMVLELEAAVP